MLSLFSQFIFGNTSLFGGKDASSGSSRDKTLCFDLRQSNIESDNGEKLIACFYPIEDIKGNQDIAGVLKVTNLRLIWICCNKPRVNLSIGWQTIALIFEQNLKDSLGQPVTSLCILTKYEETKYEFIFNVMNDNWQEQLELPITILLELRKFSDRSSHFTHLTPMYLHQPFEVVFKVWQCYKQTNLFRHCRANLTNLSVSNSRREGKKINFNLDNINKLPGEEIIYYDLQIIRSESHANKFTGAIILSNIRLIWMSDEIIFNNLSIPYLRIASIKLKQNDKIIIETYEYVATTNQIHFRLPKPDVNGDRRDIKQVFERIQSLYSLYKDEPKFGPETCEECIEFMSHLKPLDAYLNPSKNHPVVYGRLQETRNSLVSIKDTRTKGEDNLNIETFDTDVDELAKYCLKHNSYLSEKPIGHDNELIYSTDLGLAVERPINDVDLRRIWLINL